MKRNATFSSTWRREYTSTCSARATPSTSTTHEDTLPSPKSERVVSRTRTLQDLYDGTERLDNITLFCLFAYCESMDFEEVAQDKRWIDVMDEEIRFIKKNDTWELVSLPKRHKAIWCNPTPQGNWIEDSNKIGPEMQEKALGFSWALG